LELFNLSNSWILGVEIDISVTGDGTSRARPLIFRFLFFGTKILRSDPTGFLNANRDGGST
jgi:hypothetical protein